MLSVNNTMNIVRVINNNLASLTYDDEKLLAGWG